MAGVKNNAANIEVTRKSPKKLYSGVKSKVGGNIKSINKSQTKPLSKTASKMTVSQFMAGDVSPIQKNMSASTYGSSQKGRPGSAVLKKSASKSGYKSKLATNQMDAIVKTIRDRLTQEKLAKMSNDEL